MPKSVCDNPEIANVRSSSASRRVSSTVARVIHSSVGIGVAGRVSSSVPEISDSSTENIGFKINTSISIILLLTSFSRNVKCNSYINCKFVGTSVANDHDTYIKITNNRVFCYRRG